MVLGLDPAVVAHFDQLNIIRFGVHPVLVLQLFNNPVNGAGNTKRLTTLDALERFLAMQRPGAQRVLRQVQPGLQGDGRLGAGTLADAALDAGVFGKADFWPIRVIAQSPGRAQRHTGQAERALVGINLDSAIGCAGRQRNRRLDVICHRVGRYPGDITAPAHQQYRFTHPPGVVARGAEFDGFDNPDPAGRVPGARQHGLGQFNFRRNRPAVNLVIRQDQHFRVTGTEGCHDFSVANPVNVLQPERNQIVCQAIVVTGQIGNRLSASVQGMEHQPRGLARLLAINPGHHLQVSCDGFEGGLVHGNRRGRANRRAGSATGTDIRVDLDMFAGRENGLGAAYVQATGTARLVGPGMGAQGFFQPEVHGLLELAHQLPCVQGNALKLPGPGRVGPEIAVTFLVAGECRAHAAQVDKDVTFTAGGGFRLAVTGLAPAGGIHHLQAGKLQLEVAQCAIGTGQLALRHVIGRRGQLYRPRITDDTGHTEFILNQFGHAYGLLGGADNAAYAAGTDGFHRCHGRR